MKLGLASLEGAWTSFREQTVQYSIDYSPSPANLLDKVVCRLPDGRGTGAAHDLPPLGSLALPLPRRCTTQ